MDQSPTHSSDIFHDMIPPEYRTDTPVRAESFDHMQCDWYNQSEGKLTGVDCPKCKNRGYFQIITDGGDIALRPCKCMAERRYIWEMENSGLGERYRTATFEAYRTDADWQKRCKEGAMAYAQKPGNGWLLFSGNSGSGKTHLCTAICSALAHAGRSISYIRWAALMGRMERTRYDDTKREELLNELKSADVLYIDDFLKMPNNAPPSQAALAYALDIVDMRYISDRKTIFSTEFMIAEIINFDEALGSRIAERTKGSKIMVKREPGRNYRT